MAFEERQNTERTSDILWCSKSQYVLKEQSICSKGAQFVHGNTTSIQQFLYTGSWFAF
jgi:hypothetical protein